MSGEQVIADRLQQSAALTDIVGDAIFAGRAPVNHRGPFVVWLRISGNSFAALDRTLDVQRGRFQIDCYAKSYDDCVALAAAVRAAILTSQDHRLFASVVGERDIFDDVEPALWRRIIDFQTMEKT